MSLALTDHELDALEKKLNAERDRRKLANYKPYLRQADFHRAGAKHRERLLMTANRFGKTVCGAAEMAFHLTGQYPAWWEGKRFNRPVRAWAAGVTGETTRDVVQEKLIGPPFRESEWGTGMIPRAALSSIANARGLPGAIDSVDVKHSSGGISSLQFKSYERGREKWQGAALEVVWLDEEPDEQIYSEGLTRTNETGGIVYLTFTPLKGMSEVVRRFLNEKHADRAVVTATIDDAPHFTPEDIKRVTDSYQPHEREARLKGVPVLGSGRIFPIAEEVITCDAIAIPKHWPLIGGMDFGWTHAFAAVELAWDRDADVVYVTKAYRVREATPVIHAAALKAWGKLRWAWPKDGGRETLEGAGISLARQYKEQGLEMLHTHAQFLPEPGKETGSVSVEAGIFEMLTRMQTGRFKVFKHLNDWFEEFRLYHRKDGKVFKENDDLLSATRYGVMMLRFAHTEAARQSFNRKIDYPRLGWY